MSLCASLLKESGLQSVLFVVIIYESHKLFIINLLNVLKTVQTRVSNFCLNSKAFLDVEDGQEERFRLSHLNNAVD